MKRRHIKYFKTEAEAKGFADSISEENLLNFDFSQNPFDHNDDYWFVVYRA